MDSLSKCVAAWFCILLAWSPARAQEPTMVAHYIDVGQGLSVLLEFPCGAVLIDTGSQDLEHLDHLTDYLRDFFKRRADLKNTLNTLFITHSHLDHTRGIEDVTKVCRIRNYVDNGITKGSGDDQVLWIRKNAKKLGVQIREVQTEEIASLPHKNGLTDAAIDDLVCPHCDPRIAILAGGRSQNPGWPEKEYKNWNNHSLVIRVDFGHASFLFTGDLEVRGIEKLLDYYAGTNMLRTEVYQIGHHGSYNASTRELAEAVAPNVAVIGVGRWDFGLNSSDPYTTYRYGHPRRVVVDLWSEMIPGFRSTPLPTKVFERRFDPIDYIVRKKIYATGWDGSVKVSAKLDGGLTVATEAEERAGPRIRVLKLSPGARSPGQLRQAFDSVAQEPEPEPVVLTYRPCPTQSWRYLPRRRLLFRWR
jgi:competence protein ComEC